jgi:predicted amidohydrolase YtcJ
VPVLAGSDHPVESLDPRVGLHRLVTGSFEDGRSTGAPTLPLEVALGLMTDASAGTTVLADDLHGREDELLSIEVEDAVPTPA